MGQLFYVIGASGAGKDSLINYARKGINGSLPILFAHRYITRPDGGNENHISLSPEEFLSRRAGSLFALDWESHGKYYGIGLEIDAWLQRGYHVVLNGSREYLPAAQKKYGDLKVILVEASPETIRRRLESRGRETSADIEERLHRNEEIAAGIPDSAGLLRIQNDGLLEEAGDELIRQLRVLAPLLGP